MLGTRGTQASNWSDRQQSHQICIERARVEYAMCHRLKSVTCEHASFPSQCRHHVRHHPWSIWSGVSDQRVTRDAYRSEEDIGEREACDTKVASAIESSDLAASLDAFSSLFVRVSSAILKLAMSSNVSRRWPVPHIVVRKSRQSI